MDRNPAIVAVASDVQGEYPTLAEIDAMLTSLADEPASLNRTATEDALLAMRFTLVA